MFLCSGEQWRAKWSSAAIGCGSSADLAHSVVNVSCHKTALIKSLSGQ